ncbi:MAG: DnaJ domain-containing protein [Ignavibacteriales bacterium]|nr:MAG: DnaJ domain-containing protein [Ignavibacteriales bacterium]
MTISDAYKVLEIDNPDYSLSQVKNSFRNLAKKYHPDISGKSEYSRFIDIYNAYSYLLINLPKQYSVKKDETAKQNIFNDSTIFYDFISFIDRLHLDFIVLPRRQFGNVPSNFSDIFFSQIDNIFSQDTLELISESILTGHKKRLIDLLSTIFAGTSLLKRNKFFKRIKTIARQERYLSNLINATIVGIPTQIFTTSSTSIPDQNTNDYKSGAINVLSLRKEFLDRFLDYSRSKPNPIFYESSVPEKSFRESMREVKSEESAKIIFKEIKNRIRSSSGKVQLNETQIKNVVDYISQLADLGENLKGQFVFTYRINDDKGLVSALIELLLKQGLSYERLSLLIRLYQYYKLYHKDYKFIFKNHSQIREGQILLELNQLISDIV